MYFHNAMRDLEREAALERELSLRIDDLTLAAKDAERLFCTYWDVGDQPAADLLDQQLSRMYERIDDLIAQIPDPY